MTVNLNALYEDKAASLLNKMDELVFDAISSGTTKATDLRELLGLNTKCNEHGQRGWAMGFFAMRLVEKGLVVKVKKGSSVYYEVAK